MNTLIEEFTLGEQKAEERFNCIPLTITTLHPEILRAIADRQVKTQKKASQVRYNLTRFVDSGYHGVRLVSPAFGPKPGISFRKLRHRGLR